MTRRAIGLAVAAVTVGKAGARNAAILAVQILALSDPALRDKLARHKERMAAAVEEKSKAVQRLAM
jgi:phosphoribosylcarboxyaminoimidazole (NCAIR) mutase